MQSALDRAAELTRILEDHGSSPDQRLWESLSLCVSDLLASGEASTALELSRSALDKAVRRSLADQAAWMELHVAEALYELGRWNESLAACERLLAGRENFRQVGLAPEALILRASSLWQLGDATSATQALEAIRRELLGFPDGQALGRCALHLQAAAIVDGRHRDARQWSLEAIVSSRRAGDKLTEVTAIDNLGRLEKFLCRWALAEDYSRGALEMFEQFGNRTRANVCRRGLAIVSWKLGRLDQAHTDASVCAEEAQALNNPSLLAFAKLLVGAVRLHAGDLSRARRELEDVIEMNLHSAPRANMLALEFLGDVHFELREFGRALELYEEVLDHVRRSGSFADIRVEVVRRLAESHFHLGRREEALDSAMQSVELSRKLGDRYEEAATYRVLAMSAAALGRNDEARQWFEQGFAYYDDIETPYEWGRLWMAYGDWLSGPQAADADSPAALRAYMSARDLFERMGALGKLAEVNARIDKLTQPGGSPALELVTPAQTRRRRRPTADVERRSTWALDNFGIVTRYVGVLDLLEEVEKFAPTDSPILILGESGTGKELVARGVHRLSGRRGQFIAINCAAMPREIIESELFGHVAGSFTGASKDRSGLLEDCEHGTVFLDEIGEMALDLQARLLRFLESGEVRRVGSSRNRTLDTRVVAATNRDRMSLEHGDRFRADLYYRLAHAVVTLPPVRRRGEDVELLIHHFMEEACRREKKQVRLTERAVDRMVAYAWPGNVRQMRSVIRRAVILARPDGEIDLEALQLDDPRFPATLSEELEHAERQRLIEALRHANGSRTLAAKALGIPRTTLLNKMKRFGIT